jgi:hypothetical protein
MALRIPLNEQRLDADDISKVEYRPVWTLKEGTKKLLRIQVRNQGQKNFAELNWDDLEDVGFTREELFQFFEASDAIRVKS